MSWILVRIAFRNLREHLAKTLIIGSLIMLGVMLLVVGNSFMDTIQKGIEKNYTENYTGDLFIVNNSVEEISLIFSYDAMSKGPRSVPEYEKVEKIVNSFDQVDKTTGQLNGLATAKWGELGEAFVVLFGVNPSSYTRMFPDGVNILEGSFLPEDGSEGIVLSKTVAQQFSDTAGQQIQVGDTILLTTINTVSGAKIREVTVRGIHDYGDASFDLQFISFIDENNLRIMNGMVANNIEDLDLEETEKEDLGNVSEDELFSLFSDENLFTVTDDVSSIQDDDDYDSLLGDTSDRDIALEVDPHAWNYLLVKLADSGDTDSMVRKINRELEKQGIDATAYPWIKGAGMSAKLADTLSIVFNVLIIVIAIVAVIIIMNTLVISVSERFSEIGTMRAIGAKKNFIRKMITLETMMITLTFGTIGVILGIITLVIFRMVGIEATNQFLQILLGGDIFRPSISVSAIFTSVISVTIVGIAASLYPVSIALKISPLEAMNKG
ncbi:MAG: ABC transporter permease [Sphaerochaetaceae bacterium]|nr:ABC transporter permease [Sphaerochaetaceae bacterium]MDC7248144.1 ABC transporter permease [Sphaerochaetaceae bacterium]